MNLADGATWRSGYAADCKSVYGGSIPSVASITPFIAIVLAGLRRRIRVVAYAAAAIQGPGGRVKTAMPRCGCLRQSRDPMTRYIVAYAAGAVTFLVLDLIWLGVVAKDLYQREIGALLLERPLYGPAAVFYLAYLAGILVFAVSPALNAGSWVTAAIYGALFGLMCYGTYDMTNLATLKNWSSTIAVVDMAWGTFLTASAAVTAYLAASRFAV